MSVAKLVDLFEHSEVLRWSAWLFLFNMLITVIEATVDLFVHKQRRWRDTGANVAIFLAGQLLERLLFGSIAFLGLLPIYYFLSPWEIPMTGWSWGVALIAADFTYYWMHRMEHERRFLWASHSVHHSSRDYNLSVALRLSVVEGSFEWLFLVPMILLGFNPFQAAIALLFVAQYQTWIHTDRIGKLGWLEGIFNTPSVHRVHHGSNPHYLDRNYGGVLIVWDRLFDTYEPESEPVVYGLTRNLDTSSPLVICFSEYVRLWRDLQRCRTTFDKIRMLTGNLNWRPDYFQHQNQDVPRKSMKPLS